MAYKDRATRNAKERERYAIRTATDPDFVLRKREKELKTYFRNRDKNLLKMADWRESNREYHRELSSIWRKANPEKCRGYCDKRRARIRNSEYEPIDRSVVFERDRGICGICSEPVEGKWHLDHIIPLSKGGSHTYANVQVSHPSCNFRKSNKLLTLGGEFHSN